MKKFQVEEKILYWNDEEYKEFVVNEIDATIEDDFVEDYEVIEGCVYDCGMYDALLEEDEDFFPDEVDFIDNHYFDTLEEAIEFIEKQQVV